MRSTAKSSLSAFFHDVADQLEGASSHDASRTAGDAGDPIRLRARANGYLVNDRGRIPASIREAYDASASR